MFDHNTVSHPNHSILQILLQLAHCKKYDNAKKKKERGPSRGVFNSLYLKSNKKKWEMCVLLQKWMKSLQMGKLWIYFTCFVNVIHATFTFYHALRHDT
jgi:hypothetical protein